MSSMIPYRPGDVVLIPFPFTDFSTFKQRPAVVISASRFNRSGNDVIIAAVSSHVLERGGYEYRLSRDDQAAAGLPKPSVVKLGKIVTLDHRLIRKRLGRLSTATTTRIIAQIREVLGES